MKCPKCDSEDVFRMGGRGVYKCKKCKHFWNTLLTVAPEKMSMKGLRNHYNDAVETMWPGKFKAFGGGRW